MESALSRNSAGPDEFAQGSLITRASEPRHGAIQNRCCGVSRRPRIVSGHV